MTTRERKRVRPTRQNSKPESLSSLTDKRFSDLEALQLRQQQSIDGVVQSIEGLKTLILDVGKKANEPRTMPIASSPEAQISAMKQAKVIGENVGATKNVDLRGQKDKHTFEPGQIIQLKPSSDKYSAYQFDAEGRPARAIFQYECQACPHMEPWFEGKRPKKVCPECKNTMLKTATGTYEPGVQPAYGVIQNYMYTTKRKVEKYKVYFEKFSEREKSEGILESEMVLCR